MTAKSNWLKWALGVIVVLLLLAGGWIYLQTRSTFTPPPVPEPNGYDQLMAAAEMIAPRTGFYDEMESEELRSIVEQNKPALQLAREALEQEIVVPIDWSIDPVVGNDSSEHIKALRQLSRAFIADSQFQLYENNGLEAMQRSLETYRLGAKCYKGGLIVDLLVGIAVKGVSLEQLRMVSAAHPEQRAMVLEQLRQLQGLGEPAEWVIQRELDNIKSPRTLQGWVIHMQAPSLIEPAIQAAEQAVRRSETMERLLLLHLAVHLYQKENGHWPSELAEVAPLLGGEIPKDPFTDEDFVYRVEGDEYQLYSKGVNRRDDGGIGDETGLKEDMLYPLTPQAEEEPEDR